MPRKKKRMTSGSSASKAKAPVQERLPIIWEALCRIEKQPSSWTASESWERKMLNTADRRSWGKHRLPLPRSAIRIVL
jgi:hypothetical protein